MVKFTFLNIKKCNILVFDENSLRYIYKSLEGLDYQILPTRNIIYLNIFFYPLLFIKNLKKVKSFYTALFLTIINKYNPRLVISTVDNSINWQKLDFFDHSRNYLTVQYGNRIFNHEYKRTDITYKTNSPPNFHSNFACISDFEIDYYKEQKVEVKNFYKIGSLYNSYYDLEYSYKKKKDKKVYDFCYLLGKRVEEREVKIIKYISEYCELKNKTMCVALKPNPGSPLFAMGLSNYKKYFNKNSQLVSKTDIYKNYQLAEMSNVTIGFLSTLLREIFGRGNKILPIKFDDTPEFFKKIKTCINENKTELFEKLDYLLSMPYQEYFLINSENMKYYLDYDENKPSYIKLKEIILKLSNEIYIQKK